MGSIKLELGQKTELAAERGQDIVETGEQKIEEAEQRQRWGGIEVIDDEDRWMVEETGKISQEDLDAFTKKISEACKEHEPELSIFSNLNSSNEAADLRKSAIPFVEHQDDAEIVDKLEVIDLNEIF